MRNMGEYLNICSETVKYVLAMLKHAWATRLYCVSWSELLRMADLP